MTRINMFRTVTYRNTTDHAALSNRSSVAWGKTNFTPAASALIFAALLIICSMAVGCSNDQPKPISSTNQTPVLPTPPVTAPPTPAPEPPVQQAVAKPVHKKTVRRVPPVVTYVNGDSGVSFDYPRKYGLKTGEAATELVSSSVIPMDFVQPGGVALAAITLPDSTYPNSNLASAFFNVSVNRTLTADQCSEFSVPQAKPASPAEPTIEAKAQVSTPELSKLKLMIGDMELDSAETDATGELKTGSREEASKYYHVFQNGACYEFALKVATTKVDTAATDKPTPSHIDKNEVFRNLEKILATVRINPVSGSEVNAEAKTNTQPTTETPAQ
jgi:hypothetical protein